jgi:predicted Zn-dependent protease with MMP-like domain/Flp pilus assembly protein TadD
MCRVVPFLLPFLALAACSRPAPPPPGQAQANTPPAAPLRGGKAGEPSNSQLSKVKPPAAPCLPAGKDATVPALVDRAADRFDEGKMEEALLCAEEAIRIDGRAVPALHYRAAALVALGKLEDAKLAFARALAVDPDDPETLWGASDLYALRLGGEREALEIGLEYASRGAERALKKKDKDLAARLLLVASMAENDLGRSKDALGHLDRLLGLRPDDLDARYERGVALYELCRFADARKALEEVRKKAPDDPWAVHYLGLIAERDGDEKKAQLLLARAEELSPDDFKHAVALDGDGFTLEVRSALDSLPTKELKALETVPVQVEDLPAVEDLTAVDPPLSPSILGLFRGPPERESCDATDGDPCRSIVFYRKNLLRFAKDRKELAEQVRVTLLHELGHLHGEDDDDLRQRGLE